MVRYPHILFVQQTAEGSQDANGNVVPGAMSWVEVGECRGEIKPRGLVVLEDGATYTLNQVVFVPVTPAPIAKGTGVQVKTADGAVYSEGYVQQFVPYQTYAEIWL